MLIQDKVAFVTGGARGIGKALCDALLAKGAKVCLVDILEEGAQTQQELEQKYGPERVIFVKTDVTSMEQLENAFLQVKNTFGKLDILINNAGIINEHDWMRTIGVNFVSVITGTKLAQHLMSPENGGNGGVVINIGSTSGLYPFPMAPVYSATKTGVIGFTKSWGNSPDIKMHGIRMNCVCPAATQTPIVHDLNETTLPHFHHMVGMFQKAQQMGMLLQPQAIVDPVIPLIEDDTKNGVILSVTPKGVQNIEYPPDPMLALGMNSNNHT